MKTRHLVLSAKASTKRSKVRKGVRQISRGLFEVMVNGLFHQMNKENDNIEERKDRKQNVKKYRSGFRQHKRVLRAIEEMQAKFFFVKSVLGTAAFALEESLKSSCQSFRFVCLCSDVTHALYHFKNAKECIQVSCI